MTQHTQPVVAAQHQQHQQQQQQQHQQQTSTPQQQQQTTTTPNTNNNNTSNNNNSNSTPTTTNPTTNNNQTQTVAVQQHQNNNNNNNSYQNATSGQMFNPQLQSANVYVPTHGIPAHHHPQHHHHQPGAMYQAMIPAAIPSNVYVNNVTANVNLHGWAHTVPHGAWVHPGSVPQYIHGELPPEQGAPVIQPMGAMPVTLPAPNALAGPVMNPNPNVLTGGTRGSRRVRGRGGASGSRRGDYNMQRHPPPEGSPAPQQGGQNNQQDMQQQQQGQQTSDAQQMMTTLQPPYVPHPQYAAHAQQYPYSYPTYFAPPQHMIHPGQSAAAQQATGTPLYFSPMPVYNGQPMYNYGYYLPQVINQSEYPYGEEVGVGDERQAAGDGGMMWHQQPMYADEYGMSPADMHAVSSDDMNHNASSMGSANETPNLLSPNYPPMYEQMTQQMSVMQIYDDPQMGQMQVMHPQGGVPQMEEELSECGSQPSTSIQMVPPIQMVPTAAAPPMALPAATNEQILQQQTPHLIPVTGGAIMPIDGSLTPNTTPQHQIQQQQQQSLIGDNSNETNIQTYEHVSQIQSGESVTSLNEEILQPPADNLAAVDYQQQHPQQQQQQQQVQTQNVLVEAVQTDNYSSNKILMTELQETQESNIKTSKTTVATVAAITTSTDVAIETVVTNVSTNIQQRQPTAYQQQQSQEKPHKQQPAQQYVAKQSVPQQQYQHQQLQTQPMPPAAQQQQQTVQPQPQQQSHYQTSNQQQHHHQQQQQQQQQQQHHQPQQQSYENRKSSQMYNQQHQSRNRKYDYHHNDASSHQQQQQQQPQQTTKSMSWTNSSQHKKSTNTVGVTATPTSSHTSGSYNKSSNTTNSSTTHTHATRTYTNQQHHNYQQQNYHYQQQQHQPATRNHAAMKMPSSPISSGPNTMERKTSQSSDTGKGHATQQQQSQQQQQSTSTASTTAAPHQFQQQQSQQTSTNDMVQTQTTTTSTVSTTATTISSKQQQQQSQHYPPGFATKKHSLSNQGHSSSSSATNTATATTTNNAVESSNTPAINLAPPVSTTTPAAPSTPSWASLFASSSNASSTNTSNTAASASSLNTTSNSSSTSAAYSKKPIAKVAPYEGLTPVTPPPPVVTPGTLSYSAASAQNLPPPTANTAAAAKKNATSSEQQSQRNSLANLDEYSLKFAEFLTKYKSDWATISLRPRGLTNRSNYCYINSILQALLGCSPLYNLIRSIPKQAANFCEVKTPTVNAMITFMSNFSNLPSGLRLRNTKGGKGNKDDLGGDLQCDPAFEPTEIYKLWNDSREEHVEGRQEDAEEFLSYILNKLNDEMLEVIKLIAKPNTEQNGQNEPPEEDGDVWQMICNNRNKGSVTRQTDFGCTPLSDIFRGELRSRLQREGEHSTDVIQPFFTLQLNIEKAASVKEALEILVGRDQLEGVTGSKSKQEVVAWQQMNLEKLPPILILHLKWFDYRSDGCTKILKKVEFPVELKIDSKILASKNYSQKKRAYRLFAVVYHDGKEATKGHYITDVYHTGYGSWLRYDDSSVKPVSENHVLLPRTPRVPYLLCYRRCDTIPQQSNNNQNNSSSSGNNNSSGNTQSSSGK